MKLTELNPGWVGARGDARTGVGISFDCPCGKCGLRVYVAFENPLDGGSPLGSKGEPFWHREGDTFETLTLTPSILRLTGCKWHGYVTNGEIRTV